MLTCPPPVPVVLGNIDPCSSYRNQSCLATVRDSEKVFLVGALSLQQSLEVRINR